MNVSPSFDTSSPSSSSSGEGLGCFMPELAAAAYLDNVSCCERWRWEAATGAQLAFQIRVIHRVVRELWVECTQGAQAETELLGGLSVDRGGCCISGG
jgi:hypothetical protein